MLISLLFENPIVALMVFASLITALAFHEYAHAYAATKMGDPTPRMQGRLTLNPLAHLDALGSLLLIFTGIGWGKPVEFNPAYMKNVRRDAAIVAFAGPLSNIALAIVATGLLYITNMMPALSYISMALAFFVTLNIALAVFNLIPVEPLDGFKVVAGILPPHLARQWEELRPYGIYVLLVLYFTRMIDKWIFPVADFISNFLLQGIR